MAASAQRVRTIEVGDQVDQFNEQDFIDDEEGPNSPANAKTARDTQKKKYFKSACLSYYAMEHITVTRHTVAVPHIYDNSSSKYDYKYVQSVTSAAEDQVLLSNKVQFNYRPVGPLHLGICSIRPPNRIFSELMSNRYYPLKLELDAGRSSETNEVRPHIKNGTTTLKKQSFSGAYPVHIFHFFSRFVNNTDTLRMTEAQAFSILPHFVDNCTESEFRANIFGGSRYAGITCWPEAIQYMHRTYATPILMHEALEDFRLVHQSSDEDEYSYQKPLHDAVQLCRNVQEEDERMSFYISFLLPTTRTTATLFLESQAKGDLTFEELTNSAEKKAKLSIPMQSSISLRATIITPLVLPPRK